MTRGHALDSVRSFLATDCSIAFGDQDDLFSMGVIDSFKMIALVLHIEKAFAITLSEADLAAANFHSVETVVDLALSRLSVRP